MLGQGSAIELLQTDAAFNQNSGGALVNKAELIGITLLQVTLALADILLPFLNIASKGQTTL